MERVLVPFTIPISGSRPGLTSFKLEVDGSFFACFPESLVQDGEFKVEMILDKRQDMSILTMTFTGHICTNCDRCEAEIQLPIHGSSTLIIKYGETFLEEDDVVVLPPDMLEFNTARFVYESIVLAIPFRHIYNCEMDDPLPCDMEVLDYLERNENEFRQNDPIEEPSPFSELKNKINKN